VTGQTSIPVPDAPTTGSCAWCGETTSLRLELEKHGTRAANGAMVRKRTVAVFCCATHQRTLQRRGEA
jgi:hypothetical protein